VTSRRPTEFAIVLNGRIAGVVSVGASTWFTSPHRWEKLLPWSLLRDGANDVALVEIDRQRSSTPTIRSLALRPDDSRS
jgi:hypothetical protein